MKRTRLEQAINRLARLLRDNESAEERYQKYFENNPVVFEFLGYDAFYPKLHLSLPDGGYLEPDFLVKRPDGLFEIFELKTPQERLVKEKRHREGFYAKIDDYIRQVSKYSRYFNDRENRTRVLKDYSLDVQEKPDMVLVAGVDDGVDKKLLHLIARERSIALRIFTYDELLSRLQFHHARLFGHSENLSGASWHAVITLHKVNVQRRQYIFDAGDSLSKNRWSIYLDERDIFHFEIIDWDGISHSVSVRLGRRSFEFSETCYLCCEFGNSDNFSIMQILVNNRIVAKRELAYPLNITTGLNFRIKTIAADIEERNFGTFDMAELAIYSNTLTFWQRAGLAEYFIDQLFPPTLEDMITVRSPRRLVAPNDGRYLFIGEKGELE